MSTCCKRQNPSQNCFWQTSMASSATSAAHSFNKILNQPRLSSKSRQSGDVEEAVKKLRRLILVEGIPSSVVSLDLVIECCPTTLHAAGSDIKTKNMEDITADKSRTVRRNVSAIRVSGTMRGAREDQERHFSVNLAAVP